MDRQTQSAEPNEPAAVKYNGPYYFSIDGKNPSPWALRAARKYSIQFENDLCDDEIRAFAAVIEKDSFLGCLENAS